MTEFRLSTEPTAREVVAALGAVIRVYDDTIVGKHAELWRGGDEEMRGGFWCPAPSLGYGQASRVLENHLEDCVVLHPDLFAQVLALVAPQDAPAHRSEKLDESRDHGSFEVPAAVTPSTPASGDAPLVQGPGADPACEPVTSWRAVAALLGISEDTLARRRAGHDHEQRPWFESPAAVRAWFERLGVSDRPIRRRSPMKRKTPIAGSEAPVNWDQDLDDLLR